MSSLTSPPAPLAEDIPCVRCGYNLRTRYPNALCPECGDPVAPSIVSFRAPPIENPRRAMHAALLLAVPNAFGLMQFLIFAAILRPLYERHVIGTIGMAIYGVVAAVGPALVLVAGAYLLDTSSRSPVFTRRSPLRPSPIAGTFGILFLIGCFFSAAFTFPYAAAIWPPPRLHFWLNLASMISAMLQTVVIVGLWRLALRLCGQGRMESFRIPVHLVFGTRTAAAFITFPMYFLLVSNIPQIDITLISILLRSSNWVYTLLEIAFLLFWLLFARACRRSIAAS